MLFLSFIKRLTYGFNFLILWDSKNFLQGWEWSSVVQYNTRLAWIRPLVHLQHHKTNKQENSVYIWYHFNHTQKTFSSLSSPKGIHCSWRYCNTRGMYGEDGVSSYFISLLQIHLITCPWKENISDIKLIRMDTTLSYPSQKVQKWSAFCHLSIEKVFYTINDLKILKKAYG